jgi:hypothetical protein
MANPLEVGSVSPAPPNPDGGNALQQQGPAPAQQKAPPPPDHQQTVAALRHFDAVKGELQTLLSNPALGKSDLKKQIIDGTVNLVSQRMMSPADAVVQLSKVPTEPLAQRKFLQGLMSQTMQAAAAILDHHRNTNLGSGDWATESQMHNTNPDNHLNDMAALQANYGQK